jgi:hypothetical protein
MRVNLRAKMPYFGFMVDEAGTASLGNRASPSLAPVDPGVPRSLFMPPSDQP